MNPQFFFKTGSTTLVILEQFPAAEIITVPGAITSSFGYFCFMESESFPVGMLIPSSIAKSAHAFTALYKRASSPSFLHAHIQLAESETLFKPSFNGAKTIFDNASPIEFREPAPGFIKAETGECPILVAIPSFPLKSRAMTPTLFNGNCNGPAHCCLATFPPTQRSTLLVSQSLQATASSCKTCSRYSWILSWLYSISL